ncbi:hypothetical protein HNY73_021899 [Argiope bruennichi]|uniref:Gustatory receptor n=1 Tax=Argiope bruennichi TaxID=94029 RepID=A0A8T0E3A7_ARGBR|nr:hypothetical protein HNY73_021899 [Argiope bruennichi]
MDEFEIYDYNRRLSHTFIGDHGYCATSFIPIPCKRLGKKSNFFFRLIFAFNIVGIGFTNYSKPKIIAMTSVKILLHLFLLYRVAMLTFQINNFKYGIKLSAFTYVRDSLVLLAWHSVYCKRKKILKLMKTLMKLIELSPASCSKVQMMIFYVSLVGVYMCPLVTAAVMIGFLTENKALKYQRSTLFGKCSTYFPRMIAFLINYSYNLYLLTIPLLISLTYVFICVNLQKMLARITKSLKKCHSLENAKLAYHRATELFLVISKVEDALSVCIFFVISFNVLLTFVCFAYGLGYYNWSKAGSANVIGWFFSNQTSFISIVCSASGVKAESARLKMTFQAVLSGLKQEKDVSPLLVKIEVFDSVSLTAWKMFEFSKGFILSTYGIILTYGLLALQSEKYANHP